MKNKTTRVVGKISFILVQVFLDNGCMSLTNVQLEFEKHYVEILFLWTMPEPYGHGDIVCDTSSKMCCRQN